MNPSRPRIYLAGPDVFCRDCAAIFAALKARCAAWGLEGVAPTDAQLDAADAADDDARAQRIYDGNIALIHAADGVLAHLQPFRGLEPDAGTVFEVGYAIALGKPVVGYGVPPESYAVRVGSAIDCAHEADGTLRERATGRMVEGLGQRLNLMLTRSTPLAGSADEALRLLAQMLHRTA